MGTVVQDVDLCSERQSARCTGTEKVAFIKSKGPVQDAAPPQAAAPGLFPAPREEEEPGRSLPGAGRGGRFGMRREEEELERQEGCFPAQLPAEVTQTGNSLPGAAQERSRRADATLGGRAERSPRAGGRTDRQTDGLLPPPGSAAPGSRRRAGEQRFPGPARAPSPPLLNSGSSSAGPGGSAPLWLVTVSPLPFSGVCLSPEPGGAGGAAGSRCRAVPGGAAGRAVRSRGRAAGGRPCPQAGWVPQLWLPKRQFWFLFLGVRFSLFSFMRDPCVCSARVVRVLPPRLSWSGLDEEKIKLKSPIEVRLILQRKEVICCV